MLLITNTKTALPHIVHHNTNHRSASIRACIDAISLAMRAIGRGMRELCRKAYIATSLPALQQCGWWGTVAKLHLPPLGGGLRKISQKQIHHPHSILRNQLFYHPMACSLDEFGCTNKYRTKRPEAYDSENLLLISD